MKVLLVGCGSIGRRHLENLVEIDKVKKIFVYSKVKDCLRGLKNRNKVSLARSLSDTRPDLAIIANETYKHLDAALALAKRGVHLLIEKPVSHSLSGRLSLFKRISDMNGIKVGVGYNLRFLGAIRLIKKVLSQCTLGDIRFVKIEVGQYLPNWRPGCDYRDSYSASKKQGGGAALDLSHEIDYMRYIFGDPSFFTAVKAKVSKLEIDSEDIFEGIYCYHNFICDVHMDYLQRAKRRVIRIEASRGSLICDLIGKKITIELNGKKKAITDKKLFDVGGTYMQEVLSFMRSIERGTEPEVDLNDGIMALKLIKARNV